MCVCMYICIKIYGIPVDANHLAEIMLIKHLHNKVTVFPLQRLFWSSHRDRGREWIRLKVSKSKFTSAVMCR